MKHKVLSVTVGALLAYSYGAAPFSKSADAAPNRKSAKTVRTLVAKYSGPGLYYSFPVGPTGLTCVRALNSCPIVTLNPTERFIDAEVKDASGQPVTIVAQVSATDWLPFCGEIQDLEVFPGSAIEFLVATNLTDPSCPGPATTGEIHFELSNRP